MKIDKNTTAFNKHAFKHRQNDGDFIIRIALLAVMMYIYIH